MRQFDQGIVPGKYFKHLASNYCVVLAVSKTQRSWLLISNSLIKLYNYCS